MATYKTGKVKINAAGLVTGTGTDWTAANALVRVGATMILATNPARIYTVGSIISKTSIQLSDFGSDAAVTADTGYAILLHDGLTVQGLAQDVAETLRYYQNFESTLGGAAKLNVGEAAGNLMKVGAFGLGGKGRVSSITDIKELQAQLATAGSHFFRNAGGAGGANAINHGASLYTNTGDVHMILNSEWNTGILKVATWNDTNAAAGTWNVSTTYGTANKPDLNLDSKGVLSVANGGTGSSTPGSARKALGVGIYALPSSGAAVSWFKVATMKDPGQGGCFKQFIVGGASAFGTPRMDYSLLSVSPRGIAANWSGGNARVFISHKLFMGSSNIGTGAVSFGIAPGPNNTFDLWCKVTTYVDSTTFTLTATNGSSISGFLNGDGEAEKVTVEPDGILYSEPEVVYDSWNSPKQDAIFQSLQVNRISTADQEARIRFNFPKGNNQGAEIRSTYTNGNMVIASGTNEASTPVYGNIFLRTAGNTSSTNQFIFSNDGNATANNGQWKNASDERLKKNFKQIESPLESVLSFRGASYEMKVSGCRAVGVIAQDIFAKCPDAIGRFETEVDGVKIDDAMSVDTGGVAAAYSVEAIKEVIGLLDLMMEDPEAARERIKALKGMIKSELPQDV